MEKGWIKLYPSLLDHPVYTHDDEYLLRLFIYCLCRANWKDTEVVMGVSVIQLKRGQFITGRKALAEALHKSKKRKKEDREKEQAKNEKNVWRRLLLLEKMDILSIKTTNKFSIISLKNYDKYQGETDKVYNKSTTSVHQVSTDKTIDNNIPVVKKQQTLSRGLGVQGERGLSLPNGLSGINYRIQEDFTDLKAFLKEDDESLRQKAEEKWFKQAARDVGMSVEQFKRSIS